MTRLVLAAMLGANYGIYGPAFELCENVPRENQAAKSISILRSMRSSTGIWNNPGSLRELIARVNRIRRENRALQSDRSLALLSRRIIPRSSAFGKCTDDLSNVIVVAVNLDPHHIAVRMGGVASGRARARSRSALSNARSPDRRSLSLARKAQLRSVGSRQRRRPRSFACARGSGASKTSITSCKATCMAVNRRVKSSESLLLEDNPSGTKTR